jgi:hypothetical protein
MTPQIIHATFDGQVFRPDEPLTLPPNTRVTITITTEKQETEPRGGGRSFLDVARSLKLEGLPPDYSENLDDYLYHGKKFPDE